MATTEDLTEIKNLLSNTDNIESCTRERAIIKWNIQKLMKVTNFAASLKELSMAYKDTVLPDPLLKNLSLKCLTIEDIIRKPYKDNL